MYTVCSSPLPPSSSLPPLPQVPGGKVLQSVVLFDALATDFTILGAWLLPGGAHQLHPLSGSSAHQGAGLLLQQRVAPPDIVQIKVGGASCESGDSVCV